MSRSYMSRAFPKSSCPACAWACWCRRRPSPAPSEPAKQLRHLQLRPVPAYLDLYLREKAWQQHRRPCGRRGPATTALEALARHLPQFRLTPPGGGLHLWLQLPKGIDGDQYCRLCLREKVLLTPGSYFSPNNSYADHIRLSFAAVTGEEITQGIELMGKVLKQIHAPRTLQPLL